MAQLRVAPGGEHVLPKEPPQTGGFDFGLAARKWLETQRTFVTSVQRWDNALRKHRDSLCALFEEWDVDGDGHITKKEFYRGVRKLVPAAPAAEVTLSPHTVP